MKLIGNQFRCHQRQTDIGARKIELSHSLRLMDGGQLEWADSLRRTELEELSSSYSECTKELKQQFIDAFVIKTRLMASIDESGAIIGGLLCRLHELEGEA